MTIAADQAILILLINASFYRRVAKSYDERETTNQIQPPYEDIRAKCNNCVNRLCSNVVAVMQSIYLNQTLRSPIIIATKGHEQAL